MSKRQSRGGSAFNYGAAVIGMTATSWTINDPADGAAIDVAGFDAGVLPLISDFVRGTE